jgi:hypothetical protein
MSPATIRRPDDLLQITQKREDAYKGVPLVNLIAYSLYWLHDWEIRPSFEALTVLGWRLFPAAFSLVGFSQFPDAARTTRSILQGQPKYRNVLTGTPTRGYQLNQRGEEIARSLIQLIGVPETTDGASIGTVPPAAPPAGQAARRTIDPRADVDRARTSRLFQKWQTSAITEKDVIHVHSLLGIFDHTPSKERQRVFKDLVASARQVDDVEVISFLESVREMFPNVLATRDR